MHYDGMIYRPPFEARSLLLQVTTGCSHNRCSFCTMYRDTAFHISPLEEVEADLREAAPYAARIHRVFLEGGDAFALSGERLVTIAEMIHRYLPQTEVIAMYASVNNIRTKSDADLVRLHALGIDALNIGVESGDDAALAYLNKGYTAAEAVCQLKRLTDSSIQFGLNVIFGASGRESSEQNALRTAELVNAAQPYLLFTGTIHADPSCPLYEDMRSGMFHECTVREYLREEWLFLSSLQLKDCVYFGLHPANIVPMQGHLPDDRQLLQDYLDEAERQIAEDVLDAVPVRGNEGAVML